jgi:hypothetical protein
MTPLERERYLRFSLARGRCTGLMVTAERLRPYRCRPAFRLGVTAGINPLPFAHSRLDRARPYIDTPILDTRPEFTRHSRRHIAPLAFDGLTTPRDLQPIAPETTGLPRPDKGNTAHQLIRH